MGTWGTGISSNDVYEDINYFFFELYNEGLAVDEITDRLIQENKELIESHEDQNNFWLTLAKCQWECKSLNPDIYQRIKKIVESDIDIDLWRELDASKSDLTKRKKVLADFLTKISIEKKTVRKRKKKKFRNAIFEKGDCLIFKLEDGEYCGAFVLESEKQTEFGLNLIAITDIKQEIKPTTAEFEKANVHFSLEQQLTKKFEPKAQIFWYHAMFYKKSETEYEVVGNLTVKRTFDALKDYQRFSHWDNMKSFMNSFYDDYDNNRCDTSMKLKKLRKKYWL